MRIIGVNKYYYLEGGPERYLLSLTEYLKPLGHEVIPFSISYPKNLPSEYSHYFVSPAGGGEEAKLNKLQGGLAVKLKIAARSIYFVEARRRLESLIDDTKPDIVYCLNIVNHLSPSVIDAAHSRKVPVVLRLSDYYLVCPNYLLLRDGRVCTDCEKGYYRALPHKCVYGSMAATLTRVVGMYVHKYIGIYKKVGAYVAPTRYMKEILVRGGFPAEKIHYIPTFVNLSDWTPRFDNDGYILFYGRLSPEKGVEVLVRAYAEAGVDEPLLMVGKGSSEEYLDDVKRLAGELAGDKIQFLGQKFGDELKQIVRGAKYVVVPSIIPDNAPNVVYEAFAAGKPVIASNFAGLTEQVGKDAGVLVEPGSVDSLAEAVSALSSDASLVDRLGRAGRRKVETENSIDTHVDKLMQLFDSLRS